MHGTRAVAGWSSPGPMNGTDTFFWRLGANPMTRPHVTWLWYLDRTPDWNTFLGGCQWVVAKLPRLTHRVVDTPVAAGTPSWVPDPHFRLTRHVHRMRLAEPAGPRDLLELVEWRNGADFDPLHPPWEATLVEDYEQDRAAILLKWHHSIGDAVAIVSVMSRLLADTARTAFRGQPQPPGGHAVRPTAPSTRLPLSSAAHGLGGGARTLLRETARWLTTPHAVRDRVRLAGRVAAQLIQPVTPSPLLHGRSAAIRNGLVTVPLSDLKAAGKAAGVSVTSAYIATVLDALHRYHECHGISHRSVPTLVPVNIRKPSETGAGNIVASVRIAGPIGDMPAAARMAAVHDAITEARDALVRDVHTIVADLGSWIPALVHRLVIAPVLRGAVDIVATSVPGFSGTTFAAGAHVVNAVAWAPRGGAAANMSMASHDGTCVIGTNLDPAAVTDTDLLHHCLEQSLHALVTC
ncbi:wax ester/triacylglycerol synthase domain-containing protein [Actinosynnema sp. NPDC023587]|uniref:wax ester/triacylglycerol synthase domain-containing protein n=1 Tax=Actinosynnema sp. NPDC023587 TaxID=3154695 RepID=UPI0033F645F3